MKWNNPTIGETSFDTLVDTIITFINEMPGSYKLMVGTDSQAFSVSTKYVSVIAIHRIGNGGRYFYKIKKDKKKLSLYDRMFQEVTDSLEIAQQLIKLLHDKGYQIDQHDLSIHIDVGKCGKTKELVKSIVGVVVGCGYQAEIKPDSWAASKAADRHSKNI